MRARVRALASTLLALLAVSTLGAGCSSSSGGGIDASAQHDVVAAADRAQDAARDLAASPDVAKDVPSTTDVMSQDRGAAVDVHADLHADLATDSGLDASALDASAADAVSADAASADAAMADAQMDLPPSGPTGLSCATAIPLMAGQTLAGTTIGGALPATRNNCGGLLGPARFYSVQVQPMSSFSILVHPTDAGFDAAFAPIIAGSACSDTAVECEYGNNNGGAGGDEIDGQTNTTNSVQTYYIMVTGPTVADKGAFTVGFTGF